MLVAVAGAKGAVGATTLAYSLACQWPSDRRPSVFVEADPDGGAVAARLGLAQEPGLASMAADVRHGATLGRLESHVQRVPGGPPMLLLPSAPGYARAVLRCVGARLAERDAPIACGGAAEEGSPVVADVGRLSAESMALPLVFEAAVVVVVTKPTLEGVDAVAVRLAELAELRSRVGLVTVGEGPYPGEDLAALLSVTHLGRLPDHGPAIRSVWAAGSRRSAPCGPFHRSVARLAEQLRNVGGLGAGDPAGGPRPAAGRLPPGIGPRAS